MELQQLIRDAGNLVSLPEIYYRAQELLEDPHCDCGKLGKVIETDAGLTSRLLAIANSAYFGASKRIDRVSQAITQIGFQSLQDLILSTVVLRAFNKISTQLIDLSTFWHHSLYCGLAARELAKRKGVLHRERMLVAGIVHDVGQLLLYQMQPESAQQALTQAEESDDGLYVAERAVFSYTHADVGAELLKSWKLPESLQAAVRYHHDPAAAGTDILDASLLHLANHIANQIEPGRPMNGCEPRIASVAWEITGFSEDIVEPVLSQANDQFLETLDLLMPRKQAGYR